MSPLEPAEWLLSDSSIREVALGPGRTGDYHQADWPFGSHLVPEGAAAGRVVMFRAVGRRKGYPRPVGLGVALVPLAERLPSGPSASGSRSCHLVLGPAMLPGGCGFCGSWASLRASSSLILRARIGSPGDPNVVGP